MIAVNKDKLSFMDAAFVREVDVVKRASNGSPAFIKVNARIRNLQKHCSLDKYLKGKNAIH